MATRPKGKPRTTMPLGGVGSAPAGEKPAGTVRRSQVISTFGIGAILDLETGSFMPMGLKDWEPATRLLPRVHEPRLQALLQVNHFRLPPVAQPIEGQPGLYEAKSTLPAVRFPAWHECPSCHRLGVQDAPFVLHTDRSSLVCTSCKNTRVNPVRFVLACPAGHIDDFPWVWWAHRKSDQPACDRPVLKLQSLGRSASLADLYVKCMTCSASASLGDAFKSDAIRGIHCSGRRPWLVDRESCELEPRVLQRGASNIHFPNVASALSIPPASEPLLQLIDSYWAMLGFMSDDAVPGALDGLASTHGVEQKELLTAYQRRRALDRGEVATTDLSSRAEEYVALSSSREDEPAAGFSPEFINRVHIPPKPIEPWFDAVGAVSRLREVRALTGFTRIEPYPVSGEKIRDALSAGRISPLYKEKSGPGWLPAAEIRGEGIFLRLRAEAVDSWIAKHPALTARAAQMDTRAREIGRNRGYELEYSITPRLLLIHAFAHAMIRQLSIDCGYSASSLRERLYAAEAAGSTPAMNGVLVYTGSPDSEGSLGGLVRLADPVLIGNAVIRAIRAARWCGSDPVCLETDPAQSGDRISGAACHCCLLLPETACEKFNRELDRTMLVGAADGAWAGYFCRLGE